MEPRELEPKREKPEKRPRRFNVKVVCESIKEAALIERGLRDPEIVALVKIMGALSVLPDQHTKALALELVDRVLKHQRNMDDYKKEPF